MNGMIGLFARLGRDRHGVTALEYGLIAAVVVVLGLAGFTAIGTDLKVKFDSVGTVLGDTPDAGG